MTEPQYNPYDWYWVKGNQCFSSKKNGYVPVDDPDYSAWLNDGNLPTEHPTEAETLLDILAPYGIVANVPNNRVPQSVTPRQFRRALIQLGLLHEVNVFVAQGTEEIKTDWEYATEIRKDYPGWDQFAAGVGKTISDVDNIFRLAATIK